MPASGGSETRADPGFTVAGRLKSVGHALAGIAVMLRTQPNARLHLAATILVIGAGLALRLGDADWRWLVVAIVLVWVSEGVNTAFEHPCDMVSPDFHASAKMSKDIAAGAVLITAIGAAVLGLMIFLPYLTR
ncbi:MAG TPA: diacylglycerol kinase family protein [Rhizomicrobium sp.]